MQGFCQISPFKHNLTALVPNINKVLNNAIEDMGFSIRLILYLSCLNVFAHPITSCPYEGSKCGLVHCRNSPFLHNCFLTFPIPGAGLHRTTTAEQS
jgi:hypothetical protein